MIIPNVVVLMPCARAHERAQEITTAFHQSNRCSIKMVVASPAFVIIGALNVRDKMEGPWRATAMALNEVKQEYDYVVWWSDECLPQEGCIDNMIEFIRTHQEPFIGEFRRLERENDWHADGTHMAYDICGQQYARWGMASKSTLERIGGFDNIFCAHWGDVDLGLRCWEAGGKVETCQKATISVSDKLDTLHHNNYEKYFRKDLQHMVKKWGHKYPQMTNSPWNTWNTGRQVPLI